MFSIEELYGCDRVTYCSLTGTTMEDIADRLRKEVAVLSANLAVVQAQFTHGGLITDDEQRKRAKLIKVIEDKIERKHGKLLDIEKYLGK